MVSSGPVENMTTKNINRDRQTSGFLGSKSAIYLSLFSYVRESDLSLNLEDLTPCLGIDDFDGF